MYKKLLLFQINPKKKTALDELCRSLRPQMDIRTVSIRREQYLEPLGFLAGISGFASSKAQYTGFPFPGEMMVFCGFSDVDLDAFLEAFHQKSLEKIPLKAVLTPDNINWTPEQLFRELLRHNAG